MPTHKDHKPGTHMMPGRKTPMSDKAMKQMMGKKGAKK